jgi:hypothetical protein
MQDRPQCWSNLVENKYREANCLLTQSILTFCTVLIDYLAYLGWGKHSPSRNPTTNTDVARRR